MKRNKAEPQGRDGEGGGEGREGKKEASAHWLEEDTAAITLSLPIRPEGG